MALSSLRKRLLLDPTARSYGPFLLSSSPTIAELLAGAGYGHMVVDMEHSPNDISTTAAILRAIDSYSPPQGKFSPTPIVRAPSCHDIATTKRILDVLRLPGGIIFPMVETAIDARKAVASTRYPPHYGKGEGTRGCAYTMVRASQYGRNEEYYDSNSHEDLLTIVQVESEQAIHNIPEIGMVEGVDCIFLGPFDISCSIGEMSDFSEDGKVMKLLHYAEELVRETSRKKREQSSDGFGLILGGFRSPGRPLEKMFSKEVNYQLVSGSVDLSMLVKAAADDLKDAENAMET